MKISDTNISAIILAAGASKRMGRHKAMIEVNGKQTLLNSQTTLLNKSGCDSITIVIGAVIDEIKNVHEDLDVDWAINENWKLGQFSSIQTGLKDAISKNPDGILIMPVDVIDVSLETVRAIIHTALQNPHLNTIVPEYEGRGGHPVYISALLARELIKLDPENDNSRLDRILKSEKNLMRLPVNDSNIRSNANRPEDLKN